MVANFKQMRKISFFLYVLFFCFHALFASEDDMLNMSPDTMQNNMVSDIMTADDYDSLWNALLFQKKPSFQMDFSHEKDIADVTMFSDSVYTARLAAIPSAMPLTYNHIVRNFMHVYTDRKKEVTERVLGLQHYYFPMFEEVFDQYGLPLELKYLAIIESALNPQAVSRAGANGLWQFMYGTARMYDLKINSFVDERRDPVKSTHAAAQYLRDLYAVYKDWNLVIAAYNCGPGNVNRAIRRSGGKRDYWDIYYYLPRETRGYVPSFVAAVYVMHYYEAHQIIPEVCDIPLIVDTLVVNKNIHFEQIAPEIGLPIQVLQVLNPQYKRDVIPGEYSPQTLVLPALLTGRFIDLQDSVLSNESPGLLRDHELLRNPMAFKNSNLNYAPPPNHVRLSYTVKAGDNLGFVAQWYNVSIGDLRNWNNIRGNLIRVGQTLHVYVPNNQANKYRHINDMTPAQKTGKESFTPPVNKSISQQGDYIVYTVQHGDSLWRIAQGFPGITDKDIIRLNNLANNAQIHPGQVLKIKPKG